VIDVVSGYTGGAVASPNYQQVSAGGTGHAEAVEVRYDPKLVGYDRLLEVYWRNVDFLDGGGQFCDRGDQYRPAIFVHDAAQREAAERSKAELERSGRFDRPVAVQIVAAGPFYPAEDYHQNYALKNPIRYRFYRYNCGRDARLAELWQGS
jgi:peptide-methionine (S)-S-oxide reductase